jgi:pimeloyl-ACP methyl ester carboxylesterase
MSIREGLRMPAIRVNGISIYYELHGEGIPLVLIMGLRRNLEWWYCQIPELSKHFKVITLDNRGAGRSDKPDMEYSIRLFADDTAGLMEALGIHNAHILGVSMGGYIAQELALNYPDKVRSLILGCTSCGGKRAVLMSEERMKKFTANEGLTPDEILRKDMDIYFSTGSSWKIQTRFKNS